jgi:hypothetical protein
MQLAEVAGTNNFYVFAVAKADLLGFQVQRIAAAPLPAALSLRIPPIGFRVVTTSATSFKSTKWRSGNSGMISSTEASKTKP